MATPKMATAPTDSVRAAADEVGGELARVDRQVRTFVKERPVLALVGAIAAGFLVGRLLRRRG